MTDLMRSDTKNVLNLLLLHLSTDRNRILIGVRMLAEMSSSKKVLDEVDVDGFIVSEVEPFQCFNVLVFPTCRQIFLSHIYMELWLSSTSCL